MRRRRCRASATAKFATSATAAVEGGGSTMMPEAAAEVDSMAAAQRLAISYLRFLAIRPRISGVMSTLAAHFVEGAGPGVTTCRTSLLAVAGQVSGRTPVLLAAAARLATASSRFLAIWAQISRAKQPLIARDATGSSAIGCASLAAFARTAAARLRAILSRISGEMPLSQLYQPPQS